MNVQKKLRDIPKLEVGKIPGATFDDAAACKSMRRITFSAKMLPPAGYADCSEQQEIFIREFQKMCYQPDGIPSIAFPGLPELECQAKASVAALDAINSFETLKKDVATSDLIVTLADKDPSRLWVVNTTEAFYGE